MIKSHPHDEEPTRNTGAIIISELEDGDWYLVKIAKFSTVHGLCRDLKPHQRWIYEDDITNQIVK